MSSTMSLLALSLALLCLLGGIRAEVIITDSRGVFGAGITLPGVPLSGGTLNYFPMSQFSPITISVHINNADESFVFSTTLGNDGVLQAGSAGLSQNSIGVYNYIFTIPVGGNLNIMVDYLDSPPGGTVIVDNYGANIGPDPPGVVGDPQFRGFLGQSYQIHGIDGVVYNIITSELTQVNSRFVFLNGGHCPIVNGVVGTNCWSHPGSYLGAIGVQQIVNGVKQQLSIEAGDAKTGFSSIKFNNAEVKVLESKTVGPFSFTYVNSHAINVETSNFTFIIQNSDMFLNQAVKVNVPLRFLTSHGLLGQTHHFKLYPTDVRYIAGDVDDYSVSDLFSADFAYNQYPQS